MHLLILYRERNDFTMLYNGFNTVEGNYTPQSDTILLTYRSDAYFDSKGGRKHANDVLTRTIAIDRKRGSIRSVETERPRFCGAIGQNWLK